MGATAGGKPTAKAAPSTEKTAWESKVAKAKAKQALRDQKKHEKRQAEWSTMSEAQRVQTKNKTTKQHNRNEVFVCDFCNVFEGTFATVTKHEKTCKTRQDRGWEDIAINEAGWEYAEPAEEPAEESAEESADEEEPAAAASSVAERPTPLTKAEKRKAIKKAKKAARRGETAGSDGDSAPPAAKRARQESQSQPQAKTLRKGVRVVELAPGHGPAVQDRKRVQVAYVGRLNGPAGKQFDKGTISFRLGKGEVVQGWDIGVQGMRVGSQRRITVPPAAGYGSRAMGDIPANSTLCFDVTVLSV